MSRSRLHSGELCESHSGLQVHNIISILFEYVCVHQGVKKLNHCDIVAFVPFLLGKKYNK